MTTRLAPRARRALLYLQGFDGKKIAKASAHPTLDCACLDMEDGVGITMKTQAREGIVHALQNVDFGRTERVARINSFDTGDLALRDLEALMVRSASARRSRASASRNAASLSPSALRMADCFSPFPACSGRSGYSFRTAGHW